MRKDRMRRKAKSRTRPRQEQEQGRVAASSGHPTTLQQELALIGMRPPSAEQIEPTRSGQEPGRGQRKSGSQDQIPESKGQSANPGANARKK